MPAAPAKMPINPAALKYGCLPAQSITPSKMPFSITFSPVSPSVVFGLFPIFTPRNVKAFSSPIRLFVPP